MSPFRQKTACGFGFEIFFVFGPLFKLPLDGAQVRSLKIRYFWRKNIIFFTANNNKALFYVI